MDRTRYKPAKDSFQRKGRDVILQLILMHIRTEPLIFPMRQGQCSEIIG
jgi:hypothetical protein